MHTDNLKTTLLLLILLGLSAAAGFLIAGLMGVLLAGAFLAIYLVLQASLPPSFVMRLQRGRRLSAWEAPALVRLLERLSSRAAIRSPELYLLPSAEPNAMSSGTASDGAVAVTTGLLRMLNQRELEGVLAHEIAHLRNDDVRLMNLASGASTTVLLLVEVALWLAAASALLFGGSLGRVVQLAALAFLMPPVFLWLRAVLSRTREYAADATAAELSGRPHSLASALVKLARTKRFLLGLFGGSGPVASPLQSHPPTRDRVERLLRLPDLDTARAAAPWRTRQPERYAPPAAQALRALRALR